VTEHIYLRRRERESMTTAPDRSPEDQQPAWREDFPIDWPQDQYVERRDFMKFLVLTSVALAVGQFWIVGENWLRRRRGLPPVRRVASLSEIPPGASLVFQYQHFSSIVLSSNNSCLPTGRENGLTFAGRILTAPDNTALLKFIV